MEKSVSFLNPYVNVFVHGYGSRLQFGETTVKEQMNMTKRKENGHTSLSETFSVRVSQIYVIKRVYDCFCFL